MKDEQKDRTISQEARTKPISALAESDIKPDRTYKYAAFISYRHLPCDQEVARKVQRAIESCRLPRKARSEMSGSGDAHGLQKLGKCFRDEDELSASSSLPESIASALAQSSALVVICSPESKDSAWVQREINEFIRIHGRDRVFAVLASGDPDSSIPDSLKRTPIFDADDESLQDKENPLAADLRSSAGKSQRAELLRIVAAVAGCDYDDLRQRERIGRRKRNLAAGFVASVVVLTLIALAVFGTTSSEAFKISESKRLAAQSQEELAQGDRIEALRAALSALPSSTTDSSRPIVEEAEVALRDAVQVDSDPENIWRPSFALEVPGNVVSFVSSETGSWIAILDDSATVSVFDLATGAKRFSTTLEENMLCEEVTEDELSAESPDENEYAILSAGSDSLILFSRSGKGDLVCLDAGDGSERWAYEQVVASSIAVSSDGTQVVILSVFNDVGSRVGLLDVQSGDAINSGSYDYQGIIEAPFFFPAVLDSQAARAYFGIYGYMFTLDFNDGSFSNEKLNDYLISSMLEDEGALVSASWYRAEGVGEDDYSEQEPYIWEADCASAFDWGTGGDFGLSFLGARAQERPVIAVPEVRDFVVCEGPAVAVTAGNQMHVLRVSDGSVLFTHAFSSPIVGLGRSYQESDREMMAAVTAEGNIELCPISNTGYVSDQMRTQVRERVGNASIKWYGKRDYLAILQSLEPSRKVLVYRFDSAWDSEASNLPLDDLIAEAREIISVSEGGEGRAELVHRPAQYAQG